MFAINDVKNAVSGSYEAGISDWHEDPNKAVEARMKRASVWFERQALAYKHMLSIKK